MSDIYKIVRENTATFYDYRTSAKLRVWPRTALSMGVASLCSYLFQFGSDDLLLGLLTVQSILAGFTFNTMFFLVNGRTTDKLNEQASIEEGLKRKRISILSDELFYNVSYFNLLAVSCLCISLACLLPHVDLIKYFLALRLEGHNISDWFIKKTILSQRIFGQLVYAGLYFLVIESLYTFARLISRIGFFFKQKMEMTDQ